MSLYKFTSRTTAFFHTPHECQIFSCNGRCWVHASSLPYSHEINNGFAPWESHIKAAHDSLPTAVSPAPSCVLWCEAVPQRALAALSLPTGQLFSLHALPSCSCVCDPPVVCLLRTSSSVLLLQCALPHCSRFGCDPRTWVFMNESLCQVCDSFKAYWNSTFNTELGSDLDISTKLTTKRYPEFLKTSLVI